MSYGKLAPNPKSAGIASSWLPADREKPRHYLGTVQTTHPGLAVLYLLVKILWLTWC